MMNFIKHFINKYGVLVGGGSLAILLITVVLLTYITRGLILILVPVIIFWFVVIELVTYIENKKHPKR